MKEVSYQYYVKDSRAYADIYSVLRETDNDFIPPISSKFKLEDVVQKYISLAHVCIAYIRDVPAGLVAYYPNKRPKDSYLSLIAVKGEFRGRQLGKSLELACIESCRKANSRGLLVNMRRSNKNLFTSRIKLGYKVIKEYRLEYSDEIITDLYLKFDEEPL